MRHTTEKHMQACGCRSVGECQHNDFAWQDALEALINDFADTLLKKLKQKFLEGKDGWDDPAWLRADIIRQLLEHVEKGDMVDVAAFAMFAWNQEGDRAAHAERRKARE